ncbi:MAG: IS110 family transposase [Planctomycetota bacterium]
MRFYTGQHRYYCGIDLHARTMYVCILEHETGEVALHRNLRCEPNHFLQAVAPYREDLVVAAECIFCWYWLADLCMRENIPFVLGHALYMKAIHGGKAKNDRIDSRKIAVLLRGGAIPMAYVYPQGMRATRDLLRRRLFFVRKRSELFSHARTTFHQLNLPAPTARLLDRANRIGVAEAIPDPIVRASVEADFAMAAKLDEIILVLEQQIRRQAGSENPDALALLRTIPGVGPVLSLTFLYELHDVARFPRVQEFLSYARLVKSQKSSAGKIIKTSGDKIGNAHLKWAYSEAAVGFLQRNPRGQKFIQRLRSKHGRGKALSILAARLGRASYYMLRRSTPFDMDRFLN